MKNRELYFYATRARIKIVIGTYRKKKIKIRKYRTLDLMNNITNKQSTFFLKLVLHKIYVIVFPPFF